jgi:hypothetical protein
VGTFRLAPTGQTFKVAPPPAEARPVAQQAIARARPESRPGASAKASPLARPIPTLTDTSAPAKAAVAPASFASPATDDGDWEAF